jgi:hypothetical protein
MTLEVQGDVVVLSGLCGVEEAETLLAALVEDPSRRVALDTTRLHTALWQVLLALHPPIARTPDDPFIGNHLLPWLLGGVRYPDGSSDHEPLAGAAIHQTDGEHS